MNPDHDPLENLRKRLQDQKDAIMAAQLQSNLNAISVQSGITATNTSMWNNLQDTALRAKPVHITGEVVIGETTMDANDLGILLEHLSRKHKEEYPECYI